MRNVGACTSLQILREKKKNSSKSHISHHCIMSALPAVIPVFIKLSVYYSLSVGGGLNSKGSPFTEGTTCLITFNSVVSRATLCSF